MPLNNFKKIQLKLLLIYDFFTEWRTVLQPNVVDLNKDLVVIQAAEEAVEVVAVVADVAEVEVAVEDAEIRKETKR